MHARGDEKASRLILCEGSQDVAFFLQLLKVYGITNYQIAAPKEPGGVPGFNNALRAIATGSRFDVSR